MKQQEHKVIFEPTGRQVFALPGTILLEAAALAGFIIQTPCGGAGRCGKCRVRVVGGNCPPSANCRAFLGEAAVADGFRLACQARVTGDLTVEIPAASLFETQQQILVQDSGAPVDLQPAVCKRYVELRLPEAADARSDVERLRSALGPAAFGRVGIQTLRQLCGVLRQNAFKGTAVVADHELIDFEPGRTEAQCYGVALDVGTTTLVGTLVNLATGAETAIEARINPQTSFGDDVISRILKCRADPKGLSQLQRVVIGAINEIIDQLIAAARIDRANIYEIVLAGNTTMQQIVCGIDPAALGEMPFVPVFTDAIQMRAEELRLEINPNGQVYVFPQIGGFVGGDTVAGILASRLDREPGTTLFVDIGTNGEIALAHQQRIIAASVAAGPAFEGARISCGMRAVSGAIEKIVLDGDLRMNVIGNVRPAGLCGSGLIDAAAELLRVGMLDPAGRILNPDELPAGVSKALRRRLVLRDGQAAFVLAQQAETATGAPLCLTQKDVRELQLASAAIRAGINLLLRMEGLQPADLGGVLLAGGFGNFIRRNHARRIGLLPPIPCRQIRFIGNASSMGAKRALLSVAEKESAAAIAARVRHVDLSLAPEFQMEFGAAMLFPEQDPGAGERD